MGRHKARPELLSSRCGVSNKVRAAPSSAGRAVLYFPLSSTQLKQFNIATRRRTTHRILDYSLIRDIMASRSRGAARSAPNHANQDADEERRLWKEIRDKSTSVDEMVVSSPPSQSTFI